MNIKEMVEHVLEKHPMTRNCDRQLMAFYGYERGTLTFLEACKLIDLLEKLGLPFETLPVARRRVQRKNPELRPNDPEVYKKRQRHWHIYKECGGDVDEVQEIIDNQKLAEKQKQRLYEQISGV